GPAHRHDPQSRRRAAREHLERRHRRPLRIARETDNPLSGRAAGEGVFHSGRENAMQLDKKLIGHKFNAFTTTVEAGKVRLFCKAIGEENPIYVDEEAAKKAG